MKNITEYKNILWDFDGVIMDSMPIRDRGFIEVLKSFPEEQVNELVAYHQKNGGLSRYVKFRYFYEQILKESITDEQVNDLALKFSEIMLSLLIDEALLIRDSVDFILSKGRNFNMHIVSGSDGKELNHICKELNLSQYFISIHGSPTPKTQLVKELMEKHGYNKNETVLIGDSFNDYDAATKNGIHFIGYNNEELKSVGNHYVAYFNELG